MTRSRKTRFGALPFGRGRPRKPGPVMRFAVRVLFWGCFILAALGLIWGGLWGVRQLLFVRNPHFTIRLLDIRLGGGLQRSEIERRLRGAGIKLGTTNLFAVSPADIRERLEAYVLVDHVRVTRRLPDTLVIEVFEREPVAQLLRPGGRLTDRNGWILPERPDEDLLTLPVITGIRDLGRVPTGARLRNELFQAALHFLTLCKTEKYARPLDPVTIQLDARDRTLICYLREKGTFLPNAKVRVPVAGMEAALKRVGRIVAAREQAGVRTSFIDATYERNVPVRPLH
ncbi:MAG: FtsQ-type POTRA domain-containing protein [Kiritimatiellaeota bacterium]|nr:FtsQ-type POTRA domain-containing protein [Kiritimatiellota bacterium]